MISPADVTACLVTRGDADLTPILESLPYDEVIVWDNSRRGDWKCAGRYMAAAEAKHEIVYFQDDDVIFRDHEELLAAYEPGKIAAVWAHGRTPDGYEDVALVGAGAISDRELPQAALERYLSRFAYDDGFLYEADFIVGCLTPHIHLHLPFEIRDLAYNGRRLADQPWQRELKLKITNQARWVRDNT